MIKGQYNPMIKVHCEKMAEKYECGILSYGHSHALILYAGVSLPYPDKDTFFQSSFMGIWYGCNMKVIRYFHRVSGQ